jgi:transcriptional regulator with XRE-family HTH domain
MSALPFSLPQAFVSEDERSYYRRAVKSAFGVALRKARIAAGLTQEVLARKACIDWTYVSLLERGLRQPTIFTLLALSDALRLQPTLLITETCAELLRH